MAEPNLSDFPEPLSSKRAPTVAAAPRDEMAGATLTVDLDALTANYKLLRDQQKPGAACGAAVKADGYGLGAVNVSRALASAGCRRFFVALPEEGAALRQALPRVEIYILNGVMRGAEQEYVAHHLIPVLNSLDDIDRWASVSRKASQPLKAVIHVDTGMNRLGLPYDELEVLASDHSRLNGIALHAVISHLACAEEADHPMNAKQLKIFELARRQLPVAPASLANSAGILLGPDYHFDFTRPGIALYGASPDTRRPIALNRVVTLEAKILQVRSIDRPATVGYGATYGIDGPRKIATVSAGYADGMLRCLSDRLTAFIGDHAVPAVGRISMDMMGIDVTDAPQALAQPGCMVELIGPHQTIDEVATLAETVGYEILTSMGARYHRVYVGGNG